MKRHFSIFLSSALIISTLVGCSGHSSSVSTRPKSTPSPAPVEDISSNSATDSTNLPMTYTDAKALYDSWKSIDFHTDNYSNYGAYYIKKAGDTFYSLLPSMKTTYDSRVLLLEDSQKNRIPTLSRSSGDSLILFSDSNNLNTLPLCSVGESGYTLPFSFRYGGFYAPYAYNKFYNNFVRTVFNPSTLEILYDLDVSTGLSILQNATINDMSYDEISALPNTMQDASESFIVSLDKGSSAHIEYYEGTTYGEATITADYFYLVLHSSWHDRGVKYYDPTITELPISLTKEGYAEIDVSNLNSGYYAIPIQGSTYASPFVVFQIVD